MDLKRHKSQIYHALVRTGGDSRSIQKFDTRPSDGRHDVGHGFYQVGHGRACDAHEHDGALQFVRWYYSMGSPQSTHQEFLPVFQCTASASYTTRNSGVGYKLQEQPMTVISTPFLFDEAYVMDQLHLIFSRSNCVPFWLTMQSFY